MEAWQTLWTWTFGLSVFLFLAVEVVVVIGGAYNIGDMLRALIRHAEEEEEARAQGGTPGRSGS